MMLRSFPCVFGFTAALMPLLAAAEEKLSVAHCSDKGCRCALSTLTLAEAELYLGSSAPEGTQALVHLNGQYLWSPLSLGRIDLTAGGDGICDLELFDAMLPEDGKWQGEIRNKTVSQCPAGLDRALDQLTNSVVFPRDVKWNGAFHPDRFRLEGTAAAIDWTKISDTEFSGAGPSVDGGGATSLVKLSVTYGAKLISPKRVDLKVQLTVRAQGVSQAVIDAAGMGKCDVSVAVEMRKVSG